MSDRAEFIVDWFMPGNALPKDAAVAVLLNSEEVGVYPVKDIGMRMMTLAHGRISLPVGTQLVVDDFQHLVEEAAKPFPATVTEIDSYGIHIAW